MGADAVGRVELVEAFVCGGKLVGQPLDLVFELDHPPRRVEVEALVEQLAQPGGAFELTA